MMNIPTEGAPVNEGPFRFRRNLTVAPVVTSGPMTDKLVVPVAVEVADGAVERGLLDDVLDVAEGKVFIFRMSHRLVVVVVRDQVLAKLTPAAKVKQLLNVIYYSVQCAENSGIKAHLHV
jgi:hypothetical protein